MHTPILELLGYQLTVWKLVGLTGCVLFTARWFVQMHATRRAGAVTVPRAFWWCSISGSVLLLLYFTAGAPDAIGVLSNLLPLGIAVFNLRVSLRAAAASSP